MTSKRRGRPVRVSEEIVTEIRTRSKTEIWWGAQKCIALDLGLSVSFVNQVIKGHRRKESTI